MNRLSHHGTLIFHSLNEWVVSAICNEEQVLSLLVIRKKLKVTLCELLENAAKSHRSGSCFVSPLFAIERLSFYANLPVYYS
jgi:hypothetical protein